ncbi:MAG: PilZ domain-containing protein [Deltaproteobacteria bacterium]|nr:PilZ domain-containing protein [Deltaproteobacteria bacterium]MBW2420845.1 PilZ domain-containing protein [Deltaproteobacteria bacterium]
MGSDLSSGADDPGLDVRGLLAEFADLNRRRLFGSPALDVHEVERWLELRDCLERHFDPLGSRPFEDSEQRDYMRLRTHIRIDFGARGELRTGRVKNISQGGLFVATDRPLPRHSEVLLVLERPWNGEPLEVRGLVSWNTEGEGPASHAGMGIEFCEADRAQREAIGRLVQLAARAEIE